MGPSLLHLDSRFDPSEVQATLRGLMHLTPVSGDARLMETLIHEAQQSSPNLETLVISDPVLEWDITPILTLSSLETLDLHALPQCSVDFVRGLADFPHLRTLRLPSRVIGEARPVPGAFKALQYLGMGGAAEPDHISRALETIHPQFLRSLSITGDFKDYRKYARITLCPLFRRLSDVLTEIHIVGVYYDPNLTMGDVLAPCLAVRNLHTLDLQLLVGEPITVTDADLMTLAKRWPMLRTLRLRYTASTLPTVPGVVALANACPKLEKIRLENVWLPLDIDLDDSTLRPNHTLQCLAVTYLSGSWHNVRDVDPQHIAHIIHRLFPALRGAERPRPKQIRRQDARTVLWQKVMEELKVIQSGERTR